MSTEEIIQLGTQNKGFKQIAKELNVSAKVVRETIQQSQKIATQEKQLKAQEQKEEEKEARKRKKIVERSEKDEEQDRIDADHERIRGNRNIRVDDLYTHENYLRQKQQDEERDREFDRKFNEAEATRLEGMSWFAKSLEAILKWLVRVIIGKKD